MFVVHEDSEPHDPTLSPSSLTVQIISEEVVDQAHPGRRAWNEPGER